MGLSTGKAAVGVPTRVSWHFVQVTHHWSPPPGAFCSFCVLAGNTVPEVLWTRLPISVVCLLPRPSQRGRQ